MVLAVNAWDEPKKTLVRFLEKNKLKQRVLLNGSSVTDAYKCNGIPTAFWIDAKGVIQDIADGVIGLNSLEKKTERLLANSG